MKFDILLPQVISELGQRPEQEDCVWPAIGKASIHDRIFVATDGMGSDGQGSIASEAVTKALTDYLFTNTCPDEPLSNDLQRMALSSAYERLSEVGADGVGTSIAMLYMHRGGCTALHIGDCRIYQVRPSSSALLYRSTDDFKVMLAQSKYPVQPDVSLITDVQPGDYFLVCTKSLTAHLTDEQVVAVLCGPEDDNRKRQFFVNSSSQVEENHSGILVKVSGVMMETTDIPARQPASPHRAEHRQHSHHQDSAYNSHSHNHSHHHDREHHSAEGAGEKKRSLPVVAVSAISIVVIGCLLWWWLNSSSSPSPEDYAPVVTEQKDSVPQKDTMKIVDTNAEIKRDTTRVKRKEADTHQQNDSLLNTPKDDNLQPADESVDDGQQPVIPREINDPSSSAQQPASDSNAPAGTKPAAAPQPTNPNGGVTPRPVIPED